MRRIFIDTGALVALYDSHDQYAPKAQDVAKTLSKSKVVLVTSNFVVDEALTLILKRAGYKRALKFGQALLEKERIKVVNIDENLQQEAWEVFKEYNKDKNWSFTDCTSFVVMKGLGIEEVFTFDRNFKAAPLGSSILSNELVSTHTGSSVPGAGTPYLFHPHLIRKSSIHSLISFTVSSES